MKCIRLWSVAALLVLAFPAVAIQGVYVGGSFGQFYLTNVPASAGGLGFGGELGIRTNSILDVMYAFRTSSHSGGAGYSQTSHLLSADVHLFRVNDFDFSLGAGPAMLLFQTGSTNESDFGLHIGANAFVLIEEQFHLGLSWRWHSPLSGTIGSSFWNVLLRVGYLFEVG